MELFIAVKTIGLSELVRSLRTGRHQLIHVMDSVDLTPALFMTSSKEQSEALQTFGTARITSTKCISNVIPFLVGVRSSGNGKCNIEQNVNPV